jgi:hypothetical protein
VVETSEAKPYAIIMSSRIPFAKISLAMVCAMRRRDGDFAEPLHDSRTSQNASLLLGRIARKL